MSDSRKAIRVVRGMSQFLCIALVLLTCGALAAQNEEHRIRNIVLVHGAWADGSGWKASPTFWLRTVTRSASSRSRKPHSKKTWLPPSGSLLCRMDRAFLSLTATG